MSFVANMLFSASVISLAAWLSGRFPVTAGFVVAMPLTSMLVLPLTQIQHGDAASTVLLAKSIVLAIPASLAFFVPFLLAERLGLSFWQAYALGCAVLPIGFLIHRAVVPAV